MFALSDVMTSMIPRLNYGPFMKLKSGSAAGITELMMPLNHTALSNLTQLAGAVKKVPQAVLQSATLGLNAQMATAADNYNTVVRAWNSGNVTKIRDAVVRVKVPSAAGTTA